MQTQFAIIKLHNVNTLGRIKVLVGSFREKWVALRLTEREARSVEPRVDDPRVINIRNGVGVINNTDKPFVEIGMLLKRYVLLGGDSFDWRIEETTILPLGWLSTTTENVIWTGVHSIMTRLLSGFSANSNRLDRIRTATANMQTGAQRRVTGNTHTGYYRGLLQDLPGATWRGGFYNDQSLLPAMFSARRAQLKRVGRLLARCCAMRDRGLDSSGLLAETASILLDRDNMELMFCRSFDTTHGDQMMQNIADICERLGGEIVSCDCGHFERAAMADTVLVSEDGEERWCAHCFAVDSVLCEDSDDRRARSIAFWSDNNEGWYSYDIDRAEGRIEESYEDSSRSILDYSTNVTRILRPDPKLRSSAYGEFLMGIELEMTTGVSGKLRATAAREVRNLLGADYAVIKNDGSLPSDGFEVVTAPRGLAEHIKRFTDWQIDPGYRAWDTGSCGLHVHLHSRAFTEMTLGKFLMLINLDTNAPFIRKLAGRHPFKDSQAARYCAQEGMDILENPKAAIKGKSSERYRMVNTQNLSRGEAERLGLDPFRYSGKYDTVELRVFKASLKKERLLAQIEFSHAAVFFCRAASYRELDSKAFIQWLAAHVNMYPNLANWYGVRTSKAVKDAGGKALEAVCADAVAGDFTVPARIERAVTRRTLDTSQLNQYLTPAARRAAQEAQLRAVVAREHERLRAAQERSAAATRLF